MPMMASLQNTQQQKAGGQSMAGAAPKQLSASMPVLHDNINCTFPDSVRHSLFPMPTRSAPIAQCGGIAHQHRFASACLPGPDGECIMQAPSNVARAPMTSERVHISVQAAGSPRTPAPANVPLHMSRAAGKQAGAKKRSLWMACLLPFSRRRRSGDGILIT